jgi:hypothetical protein
MGAEVTAARQAQRQIGCANNKATGYGKQQRQTATANCNCFEGKRQEKEQRNFWAGAEFGLCPAPAVSTFLGNYAR